MAHKKREEIILYTFNVTLPALEAVRRYAKKTGKQWKLAIICDSRQPAQVKKMMALKEKKNGLDIVISCNFASDDKIREALKPYIENITALSCRGDTNIRKFTKIIPHVPYVQTPTVASLEWATHKIEMRKRFTSYDKTISPAFTTVKDDSKTSLRKITKQVPFPVIVKPTGLAESRLVTMCHYEEELQKCLTRTFRTMKKLHRDLGRDDEPVVLIEQFMEGSMYSIDGYVDARGNCWFCPIVHVKTGKQIGFDDFFGYRRMTPTQLSQEQCDAAEEVAKKAIHALNLRNTTAHVELMRTDEGWKVIELGPRIGGFRHEMYELSYGINHAANDILVRLQEPPVIPTKIKGYTAVLMFFAKKEGRLKKIKGVMKAQDLSSFKTIAINKAIGDMCRFASNGGKSVFNITLFNKDRGRLLADIRRLEQSIDIQTEKLRA